MALGGSLAAGIAEGQQLESDLRERCSRESLVATCCTCWALFYRLPPFSAFPRWPISAVESGARVSPRPERRYVLCLSPAFHGSVYLFRWSTSTPSGPERRCLP